MRNVQLRKTKAFSDTEEIPGNGVSSGVGLSTTSARFPEASGKLGRSANPPFSEKAHSVGPFSDHGDTEEIWKDIPGYEGKYQASSLGRVRSLDRYVKSRLGKTEYLRYYPGKVLKSGTTKTRHYEQVTLSDNARISVHALVAAAFHGPCPAGCEVLHINGNQRDNRPENLRYDTHAENMHDIYYQGGRSKKLHSEDVFQIRFGLVCGIIQRELADMYQVSAHTISDIKRGYTYWWLSDTREVLPQT